MPATLKVKGGFGGVHIGYRWQFDRFVFGPELGYEAGSVKHRLSEFDSEDGETDWLESKVNNILTLRLKAGHLIDARTRVYGAAGVARGDFTYSGGFFGDDVSASIKRDYKANGYTVGLGVERQLTARVSAFGEWNYYNFGKTDVNFVDADNNGQRTVSTPEHHRVKVGINFRF